jgi:hypothetical protein
MADDDAQPTGQASAGESGSSRFGAAWFPPDAVAWAIELDRSSSPEREEIARRPVHAGRFSFGWSWVPRSSPAPITPKSAVFAQTLAVDVLVPREGCPPTPRVVRCGHIDVH